MKLPKLGLYYLSVGSGHQTAAEALAIALAKENPTSSFVVEDPFSDAVNLLAPVLNAIQATTISIAPDLYDMVWRRKLTYASYQWIADVDPLLEFFGEQITKHNVEAIVATHVLPCILGVGLKKRLLIKKVFGIVTDYGAHALWPTEGVDGYFVSDKELKYFMTYRGIEPSTIHVTGIPTKLTEDQKKIKPTSGYLNILLVVGGIRGGGNFRSQQYYNKLFNGITKIGLTSINLTIVTGHQKNLKERLEKQKSRFRLNTKILGYVDNMADLMLQNDIIITKPGGLIISEALARGMCIILSQAGAGQEGANADFLARHGAALNGEDPKDVAKLIKYLVSNYKTVDRMKKQAKKLGTPISSRAIAKLILNHLSSKKASEN